MKPMEARIVKRPLIILAAVPLLVWSIFVLPDVAAAARSPWDWRRPLILLSGTLALWWMSAGMALAARPPRLERVCGGLDRLYRLHRHIGIGAGLLVFVHWMLEWLPRNLVRAGVITRPARGGRPPGTGPESAWIELAKSVGEWAGYILLALVVIALVRRIPYRWFRSLHKFFPLVFIAGAYHGLLLMPADYWRQPLGWLSALVATVGAAAGVQALAGRLGAARRIAARVTAIRRYPDAVVEVVCRPDAAWPGHRAGQHVLVDFGHAGEGAHPFTIASAWRPERGELTLAIKALGDYTRALPGRLLVGQTVSLEGPYGGFTFDAPGDNQIWVAGGIGVTPFIARLQALAARGGAPGRVDFFYSTARARPAAYAADLPALCAAAGVRLHRHESWCHGRLGDAAIRACVTAGSSVWFCGPAAWGEQLAASLYAGGVLRRGAFHREWFAFR